MDITGKTAIYHKLVFEVRYDHGFVYLDRCGTTADRIMSTYPEWILRGESVNPQNAPLVNLETGTRFNFGPHKYDFSLDQPINSEALLTSVLSQKQVKQIWTSWCLICRRTPNAHWPTQDSIDLD